VHSADSTVERAFAAIGIFFWIYRDSKSLLQSQAIITKRSLNCWIRWMQPMFW